VRAWDRGPFAHPKTATAQQRKTGKCYTTYEVHIEFMLIYLRRPIGVTSRDVPMGGVVGRHAPQYFQICNKVGQKSAMLQEIWPQYFCDLIFSNNSWSIGQNTPPPTEGVLTHHW